MQPLILGTFIVKKKLTVTQELQLTRSRTIYIIWRKTSNNRWSIEKILGWKHCKNIKKKDKMSMLSLIRWLKRIMKWLELIKWSKSKVNKIWFFLSTKRKLCFSDRKSSKSMRKNWFASMLPSNKRELIISKLWRWRPRHKERLFSISLLWRRNNDEKSRSILRIWEIICKLRKERRGSVQPREKLLQESKEWRRNFKLQRTINFNLRLSVWKKSVRWRKSLRLRWLRNSPRTKG